MLKGIVFDMDGLLFDTERIVQRSWQLAGADLGYPDIGAQIYHTIGFNRARRGIYFRDVYGADFPYDTFSARASRYFEDIVRREGIPVKEGTTEILDFAKRRNLKIGLATSSPVQYALENLRRAGLELYFDGYVCGDMVERSKPDPEIYLKACRAIGVQPDVAVALEDAPSGIEAAWGAGMKVIMVPDLVQPDAQTLARTFCTVTSLKEAVSVLERLLSGIST